LAKGEGGSVIRGKFWVRDPGEPLMGLGFGNLQAVKGGKYKLGGRVNISGEEEPLRRGPKRGSLNH